MPTIPKRKNKRTHKPWGKNQNLYQSHKWRSYVADYLEENPHCIECKRRGIRREATVVDHIKPVRFFSELFWDEDNHQPLCREHHNSKTAKESNCKTKIEWQYKFNGK